MQSARTFGAPWVIDCMGVATPGTRVSVRHRRTAQQAHQPHRGCDCMGVTTPGATRVCVRHRRAAPTGAPNPTVDVTAWEWRHPEYACVCASLPRGDCMGAVSRCPTQSVVALHFVCCVVGGQVQSLGGCNPTTYHACKSCHHARCTVAARQYCMMAACMQVVPDAGAMQTGLCN